MTVTLVRPAKNICGESIVWDDARGRLLWVDILAKTIEALDPETGEHTLWHAPDFVTSVGLRHDGGAIVGLTKSMCLWDFDDDFRLLAQVEPDLPDNRLNEGVVGPDGAFWIGTMRNNFASDGSPIDTDAVTGRLYRCQPDGRLEELSEDRFGTTNTFVWTPEGRLVTADTGANAIYSYALDMPAGRLSDRTTVVSEFERGLPDGSCMDTEGFIWNCRVVGGSCLLRFSPDGRIDRVVDLPCSWPTSCAFGGEALDTLYVTSARFTMTEEHLAANPQEGGLFAVDAGVGGSPCSRFG